MVNQTFEIKILKSITYLSLYVYFMIRILMINIMMLQVSIKCTVLLHRT